MAAAIGLNCKMYRNTGTYGSPTWDEMGSVKDVTLNLEKGVADVSVRRNAGWRSEVGTLKGASIDFLMHPDRAIAGDEADLEAVRAAFFSGANLDFIILDDDRATPVNGAAAKGLRAEFQVTKFTRSEALEEGVAYEVTIVPGLSANAPTWFTGTAPS